MAFDGKLLADDTSIFLLFHDVSTLAKDLHGDLKKN